MTMPSSEPLLVPQCRGQIDAGGTDRAYADGHQRAAQRERTDREPARLLCGRSRGGAAFKPADVIPAIIPRATNIRPCTPDASIENSSALSTGLRDGEGE